MSEIPRTADVVVVGGGVHGASIACHLALRKAGRIVLVERKFLASGPTGRSSALVRRFYAMDFLTRTAHASASTFQRWPEAIGGGHPGFRQVGVLWLAGADTAQHLSDNVARARQLGARIDLLAPGELRALVPELALDDVALGAFEPESGYADPASTTGALAARARELGAIIVQYVAVQSILVTRPASSAGSRPCGLAAEAPDYRHQLVDGFGTVSGSKRRADAPLGVVLQQLHGQRIQGRLDCGTA